MSTDLENAESADLVRDGERDTNDPDAKGKKLKWKECWPQALAVCIAHSVVIQVGASMSFSAILLPQLESSKDIPLTISEASWIASLLTVSLPIGSLSSGMLMDRFGRKNLCIFTTFPFLVSWLLQATASAVWHLYLARIFAGIAGGLSTAALVYVTEVSHVDFRAMFLSLNTSFVSFGILLTCLLGYYFHWRTMAYVFAGMVAANFLLLWAIPESPLWLLSFRNDTERCAASLRWLYRKQETYEQQRRQLLQKSLDATSSSQPPLPPPQEAPPETPLLARIRVIAEPTVYKPILILLALFLFQQLSGIYVIIFYAIDIFRVVRGQDYGGSSGDAAAAATVFVDEYACVVFLGVIRLGVSVLSVAVSKRIGRRPLLLISGLGMAFIGALIGLRQEGTAPMVFLLLYISFGALGYIIIPWSLIGELLPIKVRGKLAGVMVAVVYLIMFAVVKSFLYVMKELDVRTIFYGFAGCNVLGLVFVYFCLPETLGKSFEEIEQHFLK